ncbi:MAG: hypothetical protein QOF67_1617 [Mycobacterium sp.]|nr:hypothetical protein [Mycobacterium sp.]
MTITKLALSAALTALTAGAVIAAAPFAAATNVDPGAVVAGPTAPVAATSAARSPDAPLSGPVALPPGAPIAVLPQAALGGGANPYVPNGTDPFVPWGVWTP